MGSSSKDEIKSEELLNNNARPLPSKFSHPYYITTIPGMMQLIQLQLNFICFMRSRSTTDCYFYYHKAGLFWFSLASATGLCMTGLLFLYYSLNLINRSNRIVWLIEAFFSFAWASIYSAAVANVVLSTQDYNERTVITPEFCASDDITSMHLVIWINASCRKLLIGGVLAIVAYGVDGTLKCYAFLTMLSLEKEIATVASPPIDFRQLRIATLNASQCGIKPPRPKPRSRGKSEIPQPKITEQGAINCSQLRSQQHSKESAVPSTKQLPIPLMKEMPTPVMTNDLPTPLQSPFPSREEISAMLSKDDSMPRVYKDDKSRVNPSQRKKSGLVPPRPHARLSHAKGKVEQTSSSDNRSNVVNLLPYLTRLQRNLCKRNEMLLQYKAKPTERREIIKKAMQYNVDSSSDVVESDHTSPLVTTD